MMRKIWDKLGLTPWDYEINLLAEQEGMNPWVAKSYVIMKWMRAGDFRPMLAQIKKEGVLRGPALGLLVRMIERGQLTFRKGRGHPQDPEAAARDEFAADTYEEFLKDHEVKVGSDDLFRTIGSVVGTGEESVRQAVKTRRRKAKPTG
jgi:hypothetical protein